MMESAAFLQLALALSCAAGLPDPPVPCGPTVALVVKEGRPLRVALVSRVRVKRVGQPVTATLVEPVYAYDRIVIPEGTAVQGRIATLRGVSAGARMLGVLQFDFSPPRGVGLRFERLVLPDGQQIPIDTRVGPGTADVVLQTAAEPRKKDALTRAGEEAAQKAKRTADAVRRPGRGRRLKDALVALLPFHPQYLKEGTVYDATLQAALDFGSATPTERAPAGTDFPPEAVLSARMLRGVDSGQTARGTPIEAVLTRPVFAASRQLLLPEGTALTGEVTFAKPARSLRRNGQLRVLFDGVRAPDQAPETLMASLHGAEVARGAHLAVDDEGGASVTNPATRFVAPAIALGALGATTLMEPVTGPGEIEPGVLPGAMEPNSMGMAAGGYSGFGLTGVALAFLGRPIAIGLGVVGLARSVYGSFFAKGRDVSFPAGTRIQVQLAPGPSPDTP